MKNLKVKLMKKVKKDLVSERSLNRVLYGLPKRRGHKDISFPITLTPSNGINIRPVTMSSFWDSKNFMLMDIIGHNYLNTYFRFLSETDIEKYSYIPKNPNNVYTSKIIYRIETQTECVDLNIQKIDEFINFNENHIKSFYGSRRLSPQNIDLLLKSNN